MSLKLRFQPDSDGVLSPVVADFATAYGPKLDAVAVACTREEDKTKQSFKDECDINVLMARYEKTGVMPDYGGREGRYLDCTGIDFRESQEMVAQAKSLFAQLPWQVRERFRNDPAQMLDFVEDERNRDEARELGLLKPEAAPAEPPATPPAPPPAATQPPSA